MSATHAAVSLDIRFEDPLGNYAAYQDDIAANLSVATQTWLSYLDLGGRDASLSVQVNFANVGTAAAASAIASFSTSQAGLLIYEQGVASKLKTGIDANGDAADIQLYLGIDGYLQSDLWFDPTPTDLTDDTVPLDKVDALSVMLHEFGHALGINGWRDDLTGVLPGSYSSTFDSLTTTLAGQDPSQLFFIGQAAQAVYGAPVPLTLYNYRHVGNGAGLVGEDLVFDLMNGVTFYRGLRYTISALDLAILQDIGLPVSVSSVPEPATLFQQGMGLLVIGLCTRCRRRVRAPAA